MNEFIDLMYDMILESLCDYVESGELDIDDAEVLSEAAYDELFESRAIDRYAQRTLDEDKRIKKDKLIKVARDKADVDNLSRKNTIKNGIFDMNWFYYPAIGKAKKDEINNIIAKRSGVKLNPQDLSLDERLRRLAKKKKRESSTT